MLRKYLMNGLIAALAFVCVDASVVRGSDNTGTVPVAATSVVATSSSAVAVHNASDDALSSKITTALEALTSAVRPLSHPQALETAFRSYFAYLNAHPSDVKKPLLYFVDYGLPSTEPRGYVFNMSTLQILEGPFTVAHGRGSSTTQYGVPTRFSNASGSAMTSLGLYLAQSLYQFTGHTGGRAYSSVGLRLQGVTAGLNDNARARGVVAHGAPYVTPTRAGRSEGCPAMEEQRAERVLPELANGAMVYLFAPNQNLSAND
ncbi:MAG TPA: murein L,D-transpeptidase catalytic domain family protein [Gemmatimonadaceae bacterium]